MWRRTKEAKDIADFNEARDLSDMVGQETWIRVVGVLVQAGLDMQGRLAQGSADKHMHCVASGLKLFGTQQSVSRRDTGNSYRA